MLLVVFVMPFVLAAILPGVYPITVFLVVQPLTLVPSPINPSADAFAFDPPIRPLSTVNRAVTKKILALPMSLALFDHSFVPILIGISLNPRTMLHVVLPVAFVPSSCLRMHIRPKAMRLIVFPLSLVYVSKTVGKLAFTCGHIVTPVPLIPRAIFPRLHSVSPSLCAQPLALILLLATKLDNSPFLGYGRVLGLFFRVDIISCS